MSAEHGVSPIKQGSILKNKLLLILLKEKEKNTLKSDSLREIGSAVLYVPHEPDLLQPVSMTVQTWQHHPRRGVIQTYTELCLAQFEIARHKQKKQRWFSFIIN